MQTNKINIYQAKLSLRQCWSAVFLIGDMWGTLPASPGLVGLFTAICLRSSYYICMSLLNIASAFASVFQLPTLPPLWYWFVCHSAWVDATPRIVMVMHCTWLQFMAPKATQAPPTKLISHLCGRLKTKFITACISLRHSPDEQS